MSPFIVDGMRHTLGQHGGVVVKFPTNQNVAGTARGRCCGQAPIGQYIITTWLVLSGVWGKYLDSWLNKRYRFRVRKVYAYLAVGYTSGREVSTTDVSATTALCLVELGIY